MKINAVQVLHVMGIELAAPILGLVVVCLVGIIGGAFLVSWLKDVLRQEWNVKYGKLMHKKRSHKMSIDSYGNMYQSAIPNIYQCSDCLNNTIIEEDPADIENELLESDNNTSLVNTSRFSAPEFDDSILVNLHENSNDPLLHFVQGNVMPSHPPGYTENINHRVRIIESPRNVRSDDLNRYQAILKMNAARGNIGWTMVRQTNFDE